ncbi:MAG: alpha-L-fucosidase [Planctomycetales bacterium]|nr:alpha-L-fucosidase [Planctomycetales bacterium]
MNPLNRRNFLSSAAGAATTLSLGPSAQLLGAADLAIAGRTVSAASERFEPTWQSLEQYQTPEWFRDAKFGIWAHWGPQCAPERGDWYARHMYSQGHPQYNSHLQDYGHPSQVGFKDVIHGWKAQNWDPDELVGFYKGAGARYFFAMGNHHDNLDMWDSKHQPWNSVAVGPKKDIIGGWARAARMNGLPFGVSLHAAHAWLWFETAQGADRDGEFAGVPYDGKLSKDDGAGTWWEGLDPQDLYAQRHSPSPHFADLGRIHDRWHWTADDSKPDEEYCSNFYDRTIDLINQYHPDLLYFDDTALPLWPISDVGLRIAARFYNDNMADHDGRLEAVLFGKILDKRQRRCLVWDIERGSATRIEPVPWQTCTCIGKWHYDRGIYDRRDYKHADDVVRMLIDVVSKNGNLLLNIPVRGDGTIDEQERTIVDQIGQWMATNGEAIYGTRPWKIYGEGPKAEEENPLNAQGFNEGHGKPFTAADIRFLRKARRIYAFVMEWPASRTVAISSLGSNAGLLSERIAKVRLLGVGEVSWDQTPNALLIKLDRDSEPTSVQRFAAVFEIELADQ